MAGAAGGGGSGLVLGGVGRLHQLGLRLGVGDLGRCFGPRSVGVVGRRTRRSAASAVGSGRLCVGQRHCGGGLSAEVGGGLVGRRWVLPKLFFLIFFAVLLLYVSPFVYGFRFLVVVLIECWRRWKVSVSFSLVSGSCLSLAFVQASWLRCTMIRDVGEHRSGCRWKGGTRVFPKDVLPWHRPLPFRAPGVIAFWLVGVSGNGPLPRFVWSAPLRAIHCNGGCLVLFCYCLVLICCILVISEVPYVAEPAVAFCIKAKNTHDNGVSAYCKTRVVPFVTLQVRSGCNSV